MSSKHLPEELWQLIFEHLTVDAINWDPRQDRPEVATLRSCLRVSKTFRRLAEPVLYHTIDFRMVGLLNGLKLVSTVASNPRLGSHIRCIRTSEHSMPDLPLKLVREMVVGQPIHELLMTAASHSAESGNLEPLALMEGENASGSPTVIVGLLVRMCPQLEALDASADICQWALLGKLHDPSPRIRYMAAKVAFDDGLDMEDVGKILRFPALRTLRVDCIIPHSLYNLNLCSTVRHLYLDRAFIWPETLAELLIACRQLSTLWIACDPDLREFAREIVHVVQLHAKQLTELVIVGSWCTLVPDLWTCLHPFDGFSNLHSLVLTADLFAPYNPTWSGVDPADAEDGIPPLTAVVPRSLEGLSIVYEEYSDGHPAERDDASLVALLHSATHERLHSVRLRRSKAFTRMDDIPSWQQTSDWKIDTVDFPRSHVWHELERMICT